MKYKWDDQQGVTYLGKNGHAYQAIQLLLWPATKAFREKCGKLLVEALNRSSTTSERVK